jgi:mono/diheme cytochrome c family protein
MLSPSLDEALPGETMNTVRGSRSAILPALAVALFFGVMLVSHANAGQDSKSSDAPSGNAETGKQLFVKNGCYECHGREGQGSSMTGPRIAPDPVPFDVLTTYVRKPRGEMPPYTAKVVSDKDLADIYAYLQSRKEPPTAKAMPLLK